MKAIHLEFSFLKRRLKFLIAASTGAAAANIGNKTFYKTLSIDWHMKNKKKYIIERPWQNCITLIVDEISMIFLKLLSIVDS